MAKINQIQKFICHAFKAMTDKIVQAHGMNTEQLLAKKKQLVISLGLKLPFLFYTYFCCIS